MDQPPSPTPPSGSAPHPESPSPAGGNYPVQPPPGGYPVQPPGGYPPAGWYPAPGYPAPGTAQPSEAGYPQPVWYLPVSGPAGSWPAAPPHRGGAGAIVAAVFAGGWAVALTVGAQALVWLIDQVLLATGITTPGWAWPIAGLVNAVLVALPAGLLATIPRSAAVRAAGRAWLVAAVALGLLALPRAIPSAHHEIYLTTLAVLTAAGAVLLRRIDGARNRRRADAGDAEGQLSGPTGAGPAGPGAGGAGTGGAGTGGAGTGGAGTGGAGTGGAGADSAGAAGSNPGIGVPQRGRGAALGLAGGLVVLAPWLWLGAAGGLTETVLAVLAAAGTGWLASETLNDRFWAPYQTGGPARRVLLGGLVAGVALTVIGAGVGAAGSHLAVLLVLPALGFAAAALRAVDGRTAGWAIIAVAAAGPLAFVDPEEVSLLLMGRDVPFWAMIATGASVGLALLVGLVQALTVRASTRRPVAVLVATATVIAAGAVYIGLGQPGLNGDRLFVVMRDQASLSGIPATTGLNGHGQRVQAVYERLARHAERTQADLRHELDRMNVDYTPYYLVNGLEVEGGPIVRAWLSRRDDVDRVLFSQWLRPLPAEPSGERGDAPPPDGTQWNISMIGADRAKSELNVGGKGIVVGTSDSGVDGAHPALSNGFRGGDDSWYDPWNATRAPQDHAGHGTHTLGSAVGEGGIGVAPDARWIGCVNLDRNLGSPARYLDCLQFMLAPFPHGGDPFADGRPDRAPHVLTNSWGCPPLEGCDAGALRQATAAIAAAGIFFVAAAGNTGPMCDSIDDPPAPYDDVLTVGAVDRNRRVTEFSSRGPTDDGRAKPDVVAPGEEILSALPGGGYGELDGTSMAAPHVAGVVALIWSANPALVGDIANTRALLRDTADPIALAGTGDCGGAGLVAGAGLVNAYAAVKSARGTP